MRLGFGTVILDGILLLLTLAVPSCSAAPAGSNTPVGPTTNSGGLTMVAQTPAATPSPSGSLVISSTAFQEGGSIPRLYSCDGQGISPALAWSGIPAGTKSLALIVDDPDAPSGTFTHWVAFDLPPSQSQIQEGAKNVGKSGLNSRQQTGYTAPCPPSGTHRYMFKLFALDVQSLGLPDRASRAQVDQAMQGHIIDQATLMGRYSR